MQKINLLLTLCCLSVSLCQASEEQKRVPKKLQDNERLKTSVLTPEDFDKVAKPFRLTKQLWLAASVEQAEFLISKRADVTFVGADGENILHKIARHSTDPRLWAFFCTHTLYMGHENNIDVNKQNLHGNTPLHTLWMGSHDDYEGPEKASIILLLTKANHTIKNNAGKTPRDVLQATNAPREATEKFDQAIALARAIEASPEWHTCDGSCRTAKQTGQPCSSGK